MTSSNFHCEIKIIFLRNWIILLSLINCVYNIKTFKLKSFIRFGYENNFIKNRH